MEASAVDELQCVEKSEQRKALEMLTNPRGSHTGQESGQRSNRLSHKLFLLATMGIAISMNTTTLSTLSFESQLSSKKESFERTMKVSRKWQ